MSARTTRRNALQAAAALLAAAGWPVVAGAATPGIETPPEPGPPRPLKLPPVEQVRLANGLRVVVAPRSRVPLVTASLMVMAGGENEPAGRAGLAAATVGLLVKGARRGGRAVGATALAQQAEALGASVDSGSGWRSASLGMTVTTPRLPQALALLADLLRQPLLQAEEWARARDQTLDELRLTLASPGSVAAMAARRVFWGRGPWAASATPASLQRIGIDELRALHRSAYRPERSVLLLAGDIDAAAALRLAERLFGGWQASGAALAPVEPLAPASALQRLVLVDMPGSGQSGVVLAAPFAALGDAERRVAEVASAVLGGGFSSRLNQEVRIKRGLSYGVSVAGEMQPGGGLWTAQAQTQHATAAQVAELLRSEVLRLAQEPPAAAELAARQATLVGRFARRLETGAGMAAVLGSLLAQGRPLADLGGYVDEVQAVTPAQVQAFAQRHWRAEALRVVVAGDLSGESGAALRALDAGALVRPLAGIDFERADLGG